MGRSFVLHVLKENKGHSESEHHTQQGHLFNVSSPVSEVIMRIKLVKGRQKDRNIKRKTLAYYYIQPVLSVSFFSTLNQVQCPSNRQVTYCTGCYGKFHCSSSLWSPRIYINRQAAFPLTLLC